MTRTRESTASLRRFLIPIAFALAACGSESAPEGGVRQDGVRRFVTRAEFHSVRLGTSDEDVRRALGEPEAMPAGASTIWRYSVRDDDRLRLLRRLLRRRPIRAREWIGDISFRDGRVIKKALSPLAENPSPPLLDGS